MNLLATITAKLTGGDILVRGHLNAGIVASRQHASVMGEPGRISAHPPAEGGFTLLEVLVAFVIATLALATLYEAGISGLHAIRAASHYQQAISRARSHLATAVHAGPMVAGQWQGDDGGGFAWRVRVTRIASTTVQSVTAVTLGGSLDPTLTLYAVTVWITWHDADTTREVRLDSDQVGQGRR